MQKCTRPVTSTYASFNCASNGGRVRNDGATASGHQNMRVNIIMRRIKHLLSTTNDNDDDDGNDVKDIDMNERSAQQVKDCIMMT